MGCGANKRGIKKESAQPGTLLPQSGEKDVYSEKKAATEGRLGIGTSARDAKKAEEG